MNTLILQLSSNASTTEVVYPEKYFSGRVNMIIDNHNIYTGDTLTNFKIQWDGQTDAEIYQTHFNVLKVFNTDYYGILKEYDHIYHPSDSTLTKKLTCQALVTYFDGASCRFIQPITIYSPSFHDKIQDLTLIENNFTDNNGSIIYTLHAKRDNCIIETLQLSSNN